MLDTTNIVHNRADNENVLERSSASSATAEEYPLPHPQNFDINKVALFIDFDGTLAPIAPRPDQIKFDSRDVTLLERLEENLDGALAIVTGRSYQSIHPFLGEFNGTLATEHGRELRFNAKNIHCDEVLVSPKPEDFEAIRVQASRYVRRHPRVYLEEKEAGIVLHYRQAPELAHEVHSEAEAMVTQFADFEVGRAKAAAEIKPKGADKGAALEKLLKLPPFAGRLPVAIGDDVTDEKMFEVVNQRAGISIKIGSGDTRAHNRIQTPEDLKRWLALQYSERTVF